jgi:hypothetical protein
LRTHFSYESAFLAPKFHTKLAFGFEILVPKILNEKCARKTLMKLTPNVFLQTGFVHPYFSIWHQSVHQSG